MKKLFPLFVCLLAFKSYSQISFKKGYLVDDSGEKKEVLIRDVGWRNNPTRFDFKNSEEAVPESIGIEAVKEFGVPGTFRYLRAKVQIDRSGNDLNRLSTRSSVFSEEEVFLKILFSGEANLYQFTDGSLTRYFFSKNEAEIKPLIYKQYMISTTKVGANNSFRQQLWNHLKCGDLKMEELEKIAYEKEDLLKVFQEYNACRNVEIDFQPKEKKDVFHLNLRPRLNLTSLSLGNTGTSVRDTDFDSKLNLGVGLEGEIIFPFYNNKWSFIIEPTFQNYKNTKVNNNSVVPGGTLISKVDYTTIEVPVGFRHYFFLNEDSKFFINAGYVWAYVFDSQNKFSRKDGTSLGHLDLSKSINWSFGAGYKYKDRYSVELRYFTNRDLLTTYENYASEFKNVSLIFGYSIF